MAPRYGHDNPAYRDYNQAQSQLLREQDDTLELVSGNGKGTHGGYRVYN